tara:strand:- start:112 stop:675 length:564 start_codon:yes stop_codon:yes gene_type:complete
MAEKTFRDKFYEAVNAAKATDEEMAEEFKEDDFRWGETKIGDDSPTGKTKIYINHDKFKNDPNTGKDYEREMLIGEGIHLLKEIDPERADRLYKIAISDPGVLRWLKDSYAREVTNNNNIPNEQKRSFENYVRVSRLDQIVGHYLLADKNASVPTNRQWPTQRLVERGLYGTKFKDELDRLKSDLEL